MANNLTLNTIYNMIDQYDKEYDELQIEKARIEQKMKDVIDSRTEIIKLLTIVEKDIENGKLVPEDKNKDKVILKENII